MCKIGSKTMKATYTGGVRSPAEEKRCVFDDI